jgi:DNA-binding response OmpR family regulator
MADSRKVLTREGFVVQTAHDGEAALEAIRSFDPDLVVLDIVMPKIDGTEVCRRLRSFSDAYVIMLTSRADEVDKIVGLSVGADDYMIKPYSPRELVARIGAMLRRPRRPTDAATGDASRRSFGPLEIDALAREVHVDGSEACLTKLEFDLLDVLSSRPEMVFTRALLREQVWGPDWYGDDHVIDVHMKNLRRKIDQVDGPSHIKTVRGVGYRMNVPAA